jgi:hypothetical protein
MKMTKDLVAAGRAYSRAIDRVFSSLPEMSYTEALRVLRRIEAEHASLLSGHPKFALELRRRTAERTIEQALIHECSITECRRKLSAAESVGWSDIDRRLHFHLIYARGMIARGHYRAARAISTACTDTIRRELAKIDRLHRRRGRKYFMDWLRLFDQVLDELEAAKNPGFESRWDAGGGFRRRQANRRL